MKNLKKILELIRKTGDRYIFEDENDGIFVVMPADDYENLVLKNSQVKNLTEEELLNKINKDIALWKVAQEEKELDENWQNFKLEKEGTDNEDRYYFEPVEDED